MKKLLSHFAQQEKAPPNFMGRGDSGGSIVLGLACKFYLTSRLYPKSLSDKKFANIQWRVFVILIIAKSNTFFE